MSVHQPEYRTALEEMIWSAFAQVEPEHVTNARKIQKEESTKQFEDLPEWAQNSFISYQTELNAYCAKVEKLEAENARLRNLHREHVGTIQHLNNVIAKLSELGIRLYM